MSGRDDDIIDVDPETGEVKGIYRTKREARQADLRHVNDRPARRTKASLLELWLQGMESGDARPFVIAGARKLVSEIGKRWLRQR